MDSFEETLSPLSPEAPQAGDYFPADPPLGCDGIGLQCSSPRTSTSTLTSSSDKVSSSLKRPTPPSVSLEDDGTLTTRPVLRKRQRKSRAKPKAPITQLTASKLNFKDVVHQFTGRHSPKMQNSFNFGPSTAIFAEDRASAPTGITMLPASDAHATDPSTSQRGRTVLDAAARLTQALKLLESICSAYLPSGSACVAAQGQAIERGSEEIYDLSKAASTLGRSNGGQGRDNQVIGRGRDNQGTANSGSCEVINSVPSPPTVLKMGDENIPEAPELEELSTRLGELHQIQGSFLSLANLVKKHIAAKSGLPAMINSVIHATN